MKREKSKKVWAKLFILVY